MLNGGLKGELQSYTEPILSCLVDKLGDNLMKVRASAEDAIMAMTEHPSFGVSLCLHNLIKPAPPADAKDAKKNLASNKHIIGKYSVLLKMLSSFDFTQEQ